MVQEFEDLFVGAVFGLPGAYFGGGGLDAAVDLAFGVDAGSVGRDGRGWGEWVWRWRRWGGGYRTF